MFVNEDVFLPCAGQCGHSEFWNSDLDVCVPCSSCKLYPKTPSCNTCKTLTDSRPLAARVGPQLRGLTPAVFPEPPGKSVEEPPDVWKLAAITSFSVLAVVLIGAALIIGVMVHRRKSHKRPLRGESLRGSGFTCDQTEVLQSRLLSPNMKTCCSQIEQSELKLTQSSVSSEKKLPACKF